MKKEIAEIITMYTGEIYEDYSGRGMFGETTTAVTCDSEEDFNSASIDAIAQAEDEDEKKMLVDGLKRIKRDQLGKGMIFY